MEINPVIGFASVKISAHNGVYTSEPTFVHRLPVGESEDTINIDKLEKELLQHLKRVVEQHPPTEYEGKFGFFIEYTKASYHK